MTKARLFAAGLALAAGSSPLYAQGAPSAACAGQSSVAQDACQKASDIFDFMAPQLGLAIAGGNAALGQGSALGGLGHFAVGVRFNAIQGSIPDVDKFSISATGAQRSDLGAKDQFLGAPALEGGLGLFRGFPVGLTHIGGVDALVSATYIPEYEKGDFRVRVSDGSFKFGWGARVGILEETMLVPGVSVTYLRRDLPTVDVSAAVNGANSSRRDTIGVDGLSVRTKAWRVVASKKILVLGLAVGAGQDRYDSKAQFRGTVSAPVLGGPLFAPQTVGPVALDQSLTRTNYFADLSFNLLVFRGVAEIGRVSGGDVTTFNTFGDKKANDARTYGSVGFKFGF
jgi:hypothetical protein